MKMNRVEKILMNNPIRAAFQRWYEAPLLERLGGRVEGLKVLEIGCGRGVGTRIILKRFGARYVEALDVDPEMVEKAKRNLADIPSDCLQVRVGDVTNLDTDDESFDAVFNFAILHHVPDWQASVTEIRRVLKPGGRFFFQDVTTHALDKWWYRTFLDHPTENRFSAQDFAGELERQGLALGGKIEERYSGDFIYGVGRRVEDATLGVTTG